jgi:hypothetical protein
MSVGLSFGTLLPNRAANAWVVGASVEDISALSTLGWVVRTMGSAADALPSGMVWTYGGFWPHGLLHRRWLLRECRPPAGQKRPRAGRLDSSECQIGWSGFPKDSSSFWSAA